ncbi:MAG: hypothetical protein QME94_06205 [Anaerolineae bacterium]|nr:hypothetical protein [Anaerolineae bacterium]
MRSWTDTTYDLAMRRHEAWWDRAVIDRPVVIVSAVRPIEEPDSLPYGAAHIWGRPGMTAAEALRWYTEPDLVAGRLATQVERVFYYAGDALPVVFPVATNLPAISAAYLGCPYHIHAESLTGWADPVVTDLEHRAPFMFDRQSAWWRITERLIEAVGSRRQGRYLMGAPDLNGPGEILARMRGTQELAFDCVDRPEAVRRAREELDRLWLEMWQAVTTRLHTWQEGCIFWMGVWSSRPATDLQCDFSAMISSKMFEVLFLPGLEQQTRWIDRTVYHLDGPGEIAHLDALLSLPRLNAIQWIPNPAQRRATHWLPLFRRIQAGGKGLYVYAFADEVETLLDELRPEGLLINTTCATPGDADELMARVSRWSRRQSCGR